MAQYIKQGNIFGRLGTGIGKGFAEEFPKEFEHQRFRTEARNLGENIDKLSPMQGFLEASGIRGATPQFVQSLGELAKFGADRRQALNEGQRQGEGQGQIQPGKTQDQQRNRNPNQQNENNQFQNQGTGRENLVSRVNDKLPYNNKGLTTYDPIQAALGDIREPTQQEIFQKRGEILQRNPVMSVPAAEQQARDFFKSENDQKLASISKGLREEAIESKITEKKAIIKNHLGTLANDIPEETFDRSVQRQQYDVANGKTITKAANDEKKNMLDFSKAYNSLKNNIGTRPLMQSVTPEMGRSIDNLKPAFKKNDELPLFKNTLVNNLDIGDHLASYKTWNPGKKIEQAIINTSVKDSPEDIAARLGKLVNNNPEESLFGLGFLLNKIGVDDKAVIDQIMNLSENGIINLDQRQLQEGAEYYPVQPKLEDDYFMLMGGLVAGPLFRYITGERTKVGTTETLKRQLGGKK